MPGLIGSQGIRPGALNMNRIFRALRYRSEQAQYVTYHRLPIYETDAYGVPDGDEAAPELLLPDLPAIIRPAVTADYQQERAGNNIVGAARIYTPNINTIKNYPNFDQGNFTGTAQFNEIQGWDRLITNYRSILYAETSGTTGWSASHGAITSDGESITNTLTNNGTTTYTAPTANVNILEADRLRLKVKPNFAMGLTKIVITNAAAQTLTYTPTALTVTADAWLTLDLPYVSGTVADNTSIYQSGTRYATPVTSSATTFNYESNLTSIVFHYTGYTGVTNTIKLREVEFYKSVSWHVHSLKDMTDGYIIFNCVRTAGRDDARRRAE